MKNKLLVTGASGLVGYAVMRHFLTLPDWQVVGLSRRRPIGLDGAQWLELDLTDRERCAAVLAPMTDVTHVVYAALYETDDLIAGWTDPEQMRINDHMFRNCIDPLTSNAGHLQHLTLLQGTKAYGVHLEPAPVPARERWSRHRHDNFYWLQEDHLRRLHQNGNWSFTILRPQIIFGESVGSAMNPIPALGVYAALLREAGEALHFPGGAPRIGQAVDADLLARGCAWAATNAAAQNQTFNINNGEAFEWATVWPTIADAFGMQVGQNRPQCLAAEMPARQSDWDRIHSKYALQSPRDLKAFVGLSFQYLDRNFAFGQTGSVAPTLVSTVKIRQAGFHDCVDTEMMFDRLIRRYQALRWLPPRE